MSNLNLNKVILGGRITANPELKTTPNNVSVCSFTMAVNRAFNKDGENNADFINCIAWRTNAEVIAKHIKKGTNFAIEGNIQTRSWVDNNNSKRYATEVVVDKVYFIESKKETATTDAMSIDKPAENFEEIGDADLPF